MVGVYLLLFAISIINCVKGFPFVLSVEIWLKLGSNLDINPLIVLYYSQTIIERV